MFNLNPAVTVFSFQEIKDKTALVILSHCGDTFSKLQDYLFGVFFKFSFTSYICKTFVLDSERYAIA